MNDQPIPPTSHEIHPVRLELDAEIWAHRLHYGQERDGYSALYWLTTVRDVQRLLRGEREHPLRCDASPERDATWRDAVIVDLLDAHRDCPHPLWTLLLCVAFERHILEARGWLGEDWPEAEAARLVHGAFEASLAALSRFEGIRRSVLLVERRLAENTMAVVARRRRKPPLGRPAVPCARDERREQRAAVRDAVIKARFRRTVESSRAGEGRRQRAKPIVVARSAWRVGR